MVHGSLASLAAKVVELQSSHEAEISFERKVPLLLR